MTSALTPVGIATLYLRLGLLTPWQILFGLLRCIAISISRNLALRPFFVCACLRVALGTLTAEQIQYLRFSTRETYEKWMQRKNASVNLEPETGQTMTALSHDIEPLMDSEASLLWVGNRKTAKTVVLFLHGGGYIAPLLPGHLEWCLRVFVNAGEEAGNEVAVAVLEYTLCPKAQYPIQLQQAAIGLHHILQSGRRLEEIFICGDSAGGNLAAQLAMHLCRPVPDVQPIAARGRLKGVCLVSPWLSLRTNYESFRTNGVIDMLSAKIVLRSTKYLLRDCGEGKPDNGYQATAFPLDWDSAPFDRLSSVISRLYITVGEQEVFRDQVIQAVSKIQDGNRSLSVTFELQKYMAHDFILLEGQSGRSGECMNSMKRWILNALSADMRLS